MVNYMCGILVSNPWSTDPGVGCSHMVTLPLGFEGTSSLMSILAAPGYTSTSTK